MDTVVVEGERANAALMVMFTVLVFPNESVTRRIALPLEPGVYTWVPESMLPGPLSIEKFKGATPPVVDSVTVLFAAIVE